MRVTIHWRLLKVLTIGLLMATFAGNNMAQEKKPYEKHDASALYGSLRDVINNGAQIFNDAGDHAGCYRLYQGSLISVRPFLAPALQKKIDDTLAKADGLPSFADRAFKLREIIDEVRTQVKPAETKKAEEKKKVEEKKKEEKKLEEKKKVEEKKKDDKKFDEKKKDDKKFDEKKKDDKKFDEKKKDDKKGDPKADDKKSDEKKDDDKKKVDEKDSVKALLRGPGTVLAFAGNYPHDKVTAFLHQGLCDGRRQRNSVQ